MGTPKGSREPCPDRILNYIGGAFGMGAGFASYNSPQGLRIIGSAQAVRMNASHVGDSFAVWDGLFSSFDCTMVYLRQKEDPWNSIIAGAASGGLLSMRQGLTAASRSAAFGGILLALIEGAGIMLNKLMVAQQQPPIFVDELPGMPGQLPGVPSVTPEPAETSTSWFGGLFGGKNKNEEKERKEAKTDILESFDAPMPPTFEFK